jgi:hypothetical protein
LIIRPDAINKRLLRKVIPAKQAVAETVSCYPEFISGSQNPLILLDAEASSA